MNQFLVLLSIMVLQMSIIRVQSQTALQERRKLNASDFVFDFNKANTIVGEGGTSKTLFLENHAALKGTGVSSFISEIYPCGIVPPHLHPRASELYHVLTGTLMFGIIEENGGRYLENNVTAGGAIVVPQGLIHFVQNIACVNSTFLASFGHEDPGALTISTNLFRMNQQALTSSFNQPDSIIDSIRSSVRPSPAAGVGECRRRCGLPPTSC